MQYSRGHDTKYADDDIFIKILFRVYPIMLMKSRQVFLSLLKIQTVKVYITVLEALGLQSAGWLSVVMPKQHTLLV